jgi:hypothetical protein
VALLIVAAASAVAVGQQCARRPATLPFALAKVLVAAALAALTMALLGYAGGGRLGNFGDVGVDQATFGPAVFLWFAVIGTLTSVMSGGVRRRPRRVAAPPEPVPDDDEYDALPPGVINPDDAVPTEIEPPIEPPAPKPEPEPEPEPEPRTVRPATHLVDLEDHFFIDDDDTNLTGGEPRRPAD